MINLIFLRQEENINRLSNGKLNEKDKDAFKMYGDWNST